MALIYRCFSTSIQGQVQPTNGLSGSSSNHKVNSQGVHSTSSNWQAESSFTLNSTKHHKIHNQLQNKSPNYIKPIFHYNISLLPGNLKYNLLPKLPRLPNFWPQAHETPFSNMSTISQLKTSGLKNSCLPPVAKNSQYFLFFDKFHSVRYNRIKYFISFK